MHVIPLEHILQGKCKKRSASKYYEAGSDIEISAAPPSDLEYESKMNGTGTTSSLKYALVVTVEMSKTDDEHGPQQLPDIVAHITMINLSQSSAGKCTSSIEMQCVQTTKGEIYCIENLFVPEKECITCGEKPVTIAVLPCRHACMCRPCFQKLTDCSMCLGRMCPMCRERIKEYFELQHNDCIDDAEGLQVIIFVQRWGAFFVFQHERKNVTHPFNKPIQLIFDPPLCNFT